MTQTANQSETCRKPEMWNRVLSLQLNGYISYHVQGLSYICVILWRALFKPPHTSASRPQLFTLPAEPHFASQMDLFVNTLTSDLCSPCCRLCSEQTHQLPCSGGKTKNAACLLEYTKECPLTSVLE